MTTNWSGKKASEWIVGTGRSGHRFRGMRYRFLGRTSLAVSELCLGAMTFGRETDEELSLRMVDRFAEAGGTFIDTSDRPAE